MYAVAPVNVIVGAVRSMSMLLTVAVAVLPAASVAVRVTTWSFEKAGDSTGAHVHEYNYVIVPVTGGTLTAVSTTDGSARTITQVAGSPYTGQAGLAHTVTADADGIVFVEVELKN